jgi:plastocyanin domain-containing protein
MKIVGCIVAIAVALVTGCEKRAAPAPRETLTANGTRVIPILVGDDGFNPAKLSAAPGTELELVFTRKTKSDCGSQVKVGDGPLVELPVDQPITVAVTVPLRGEVALVCGMDMMKGVIVVD